MEFQPPQKYTAKLQDKIVHNDKFIQLHFELSEPHRLSFLAGQYVSIKVADRGDRRPYSICSAPVVDHSFELLVDVTPHGVGIEYLLGLDFGAEIELLGPMGRFVVPDMPSEQALQFVATGSGIAPMRSMLLDQLQTKKDTRPMTLYWGLRHEEDTFWLLEFEELAHNFSNFSFHPVLSKPKEAWSLCRGRVTDCVKTHQQPEQAGYYLCGNSAMLEDMINILKDQKVPEEHVHHESFF
ncbi:MAG: FAD-binding oxidoreductase [Patescibacteria group bacterium]